MRVLVTGATGFLGNAVSHELVDAGHEVTALTRRDINLDGVEVVIHALERDGLEQALATRRFDAVCHLAAVTRVRKSIEDPVFYFRINLNGTVNLLAALGATGNSGANFVFASTASVYGAGHEGRLSEDMTPRPQNAYAATKWAAEQLLDHLGATGASATTLRCFNIGGAAHGIGDPDGSRIIPAVLNTAARRQAAVTVNGDGSALREYTHVLDVAHAFRLAAEQPQAGHRILNVGTGHGISVRKIIDTAAEVTGRPIPVEHRPARPEPHQLVADPRRITTELGWDATHSDVRTILTDAWTAVRQPDAVGA